MISDRAIVAALVREELARSDLATRVRQMQAGPIHEFGATGEPAFAAGWVNFDNNAAVPSTTAGHRNGGYYIVGQEVQCLGVVKGGAGVIVQLPVAPPVQRGYDVIGNAVGAFVTIGADGVLTLQAGSSAFVFLDQIRFRLA